MTPLISRRSTDRDRDYFGGADICPSPARRFTHFRLKSLRISGDLRVDESKIWPIARSAVNWRFAIAYRINHRIVAKLVSGDPFQMPSKDALVFRSWIWQPQQHHRRYEFNSATASSAAHLQHRAVSVGGHLQTLGAPKRRCLISRSSTKSSFRSVGRLCRQKPQSAERIGFELLSRVLFGRCTAYGWLRGCTASLHLGRRR